MNEMAVWVSNMMSWIDALGPLVDLGLVVIVIAIIVLVVTCSEDGGQSK